MKPPREPRARRAELRLSLLYESSKLLTGFETVETTVSAVLEVVGRAVPLRSVLLIERTGLPPRLYAWRAAQENPEHVESVKRLALASHRELTGADMERLEEHQAVLEESPEPLQGARSEGSRIVLPIVLGRQPVFGTFHVEGLVPLGEDDLVFLNAVATELAIALDRHRAFRHEIEVRARAETAESEVRRLNAGLERLVAERTAELEEAVAELDRFAHTLAHDLRAPLRSMHRHSEALLQAPAVASERGASEHARRVMAGSRRLETLISDFLSFSRMTRERLVCAPVDPQSCLDQALETLRQDIAAAGATVEIAKPLPAVMGHRGALALVFTHLLSNALKFASPGVAPRVSIRAEERGGQVRLWVEDNGIGIPPEHQKRVFEVFERLDPARPGTGIGLAFVKKALERMKGKAGVESGPGPGSRFWLELAKARP